MKKRVLKSKKAVSDTIQFGLGSVDKKFGPIQKGRLTAVVSFDRTAGSGLVDALLATATCKSGNSVLYVTPYDNETIGSRILSYKSKIESAKLKSGNLTRNEFGAIMKLCGSFTGTFLTVLDPFDTENIDSLPRKIESAIPRVSPNLIVVDDLQNNRSFDPAKNPKFIKALYKIAKKNSIPVLLVSYMNSWPLVFSDGPDVSKPVLLSSIYKDISAKLIVYRTHQFRRGVLTNKLEAIVTRDNFKKSASFAL